MCSRSVLRRKRNERSRENHAFEQVYIIQNLPLHSLKKMFLAQVFFSLSLLYLIDSHLQINLHQTHGLDQHNTTQ